MTKISTGNPNLGRSRKDRPERAARATLATLREELCFGGPGLDGVDEAPPRFDGRDGVLFESAIRPTTLQGGSHGDAVGTGVRPQPPAR